MVKALITLDENTNRVLNIVKATYDLKDKSEAIRFVVSRYTKLEKEPVIRPEVVREILAAEKEEGILIKDFARHFGLKK